MPVAVVALDFDPVLRIGDLAVRLDTILSALGVLLALLAAGWIASRTSAPGFDAPVGVAGQRWLRVDDLLFLVLAAVPGAVIGGRIGYALLHLDYYGANPGAIADPGQGSFELAMAVAGAAVTGAYGARMLSEPVGRWFHVAALPTLLALGVGKVAMALGGRGQGAPSAAEWATSYVGPGPWGTLVPEIPAHPAQLYEAAAILVVALVVVALSSAGAFDRRDGLAWLVAVGGWAAGRASVAATWLDAPVIGPLRAGQLIAMGLILACLSVGYVVVRRQVGDQRGAFPPEPRWPDPERRPRF